MTPLSTSSICTRRGATAVAVPEHLQLSLGLPKGPVVWLVTANGTVQGYSSRISSIKLGSIEMRGIKATISPGMKSNEVLLGMSFLKSLTLVQEGRTLRISKK